MRRLTSAILASALLVPLLGSAAAEAAPARRITYTQWDSAAQLRAGTATRVRVTAGGRVALSADATTGSWTSPWTTPGYALTELIASWRAATPGATSIRVYVRGRTTAATSSWDRLAVWASGDRYVRRTTTSGQSDDLGSVNVDTWSAPAGVTAYQVRVALARRSADAASPWVDTVGAVASRLPATSDVATSAPGVAGGLVLDVPRYSQMTHRGHYPAWGGGGEAWCSPTATSMVLGYYGALPPAPAYAWVPKGHVDPWVDHAARQTFDHGYDGTGNWPFNTAYAATRAGNGFVTRLRSLREAELFIKAGLPLVASVSFGPGDLDGAPISSTNGHLLVIAGFTSSGDVVVNDPAARTRTKVRRTYDRGQFEDAWLPRSGGLVYVISDDAHPLPKSRGNW